MSFRSAQRPAIPCVWPARVASPLGSRCTAIDRRSRSASSAGLLSHPRRRSGASAWRRRLTTARSLGIDATAYRLVHGEADRLPGLVVDKYADYLVVQALTQGMDRLLPEITAILVDVVKPAGILARNDPRVRLLEGLEQRVDVLHGDVPTDDRDPRIARHLRRRSVSWAEDRTVPRPAREQSRGSAICPRPAARRLQLQRRVCPVARATMRSGAGGGHIRRSRVANPLERGAQRPRERRSTRDERLR